MPRIDAAEARRLLDPEIARGHAVDARLLREIDAPGQIFREELDQEAFLSLVWQSDEVCRPLAPIGLGRTLRECAGRLAMFNWSFDVLVGMNGERPWFRRCAEIHRNFRGEDFGVLAVTPLERQERIENPQGSYYIYHGVHRSIVLAHMVLRQELEFAPLTVLLLTPRRV